MPKVSIIIPVYNVEQYLRKCLDSVVNQTLKDIEIICVNDGSTDGSLAILEEHAEKDNRIKVISKANSGYGHTMNVGLDAATGEYIGIVESDDYVKPEMYETLYNLATDNDVDIIKADFYRFTDDNGKLKLDYNDLSYGKSQYYNRALDPTQNIEIFKFILNTWSGIYCRAFVEKHHIRHNETPGASFQDNGFFFQTFCQASKIYFVDQPLYMNRRDNPNSSVKSRDKVFCMCDEYRFIREFLERNPGLKEQYITVYWYKKFHNYMFTYHRVAPEYKMLFLEQFSKEFKEALDNGELDHHIFTTREWEIIDKIIHQPAAFHQDKMKKITGVKQVQKKKGLRHYIVVFFRSLKQNGLFNTLRLIKKKIRGWIGCRKNV